MNETAKNLILIASKRKSKLESGRSFSRHDNALLGLRQWGRKQKQLAKDMRPKVRGLRQKEQNLDQKY